MATQANNQATVTQTKTRFSVLAQNLAALAFGIIILSAVGFAPMGVAHNAAHDVRHTLSFPCH